MISVKKQGPFEVFSRGVEEPWSIWRDGRPFKQVWTWVEVEAILRGDKPKHARKAREPVFGPKQIRAKLKALGYHTVKTSSAHSGVRGGWEGVAMPYGGKFISSGNKASQLDVLLDLLAQAEAGKTAHSTKGDGSDDAWDVAMDAIYEHDSKKAARVVRGIRDEYGTEASQFHKAFGMFAPDAFLTALNQAPADVQRKFETLLMPRGARRWSS